MTGVGLASMSLATIAELPQPAEINNNIDKVHQITDELVQEIYNLNDQQEFSMLE